MVIDAFMSYAPEDITSGVFVSVFVGVIIMVLMFFLLHPRSSHKQKCLEVK